MELPRASQQEDARPMYQPTLWGDFFLHHIPCSPAQYSVLKASAKLKKEEVKTMLLATSSFDLPEQLEIIDTLERLGLGHHYTKEIDELLHNISEPWDRDLDLSTTSLYFYLLRKHGYDVPCDIFLKFRDDKGYIVSSDARCLLRLYDAAHLRVHGEEILDNILTSTQNQLQRIVENLEPKLKEEVEYALKSPIFRRLNRVEARRYISVYEEKTTHNDILLEFAKLDFNILQILYCEELKGLTLWDEEEAEQCPAYLRALYINILTTVKAIEEDLKHQKNKHATLVKELIIDAARCYNAEVEWRDKKYVPATVEEHLKISARSSACMHLVSNGFISIGDVATAEAIEWASTYPKIVQAGCIIGRVANDIMSYKREKESEDMVTTVEACAKEHGITTEQAIEKLRQVIEEAWMDITEECLSQPQPMVLLERVVSMARTMDFLYKDVDGYTESSAIKETLDSLYVNLIP